MRCKLISYQLKNGSAPGSKAKKLKSSNVKFNSHTSSHGVKDNRKFQNDKMLSEAEKMARRMDLESMKNKLSGFNANTSEKMFTPIQSEKVWDKDPMLLKVKQLGGLDEGLNDSSSEDEEDTKNDSGKYFVDGTTPAKYKKKTLEDMVRESKIKKMERQAENEKDSQMMKSLDTNFNTIFRHVLPKIGEHLKLKMKDSPYEPLTDDLGCDEGYEMLSLAEKPKRVELEVLGVENNEKKNEKLVSNKLERLKEHLKKAGINSDDETEELYASDLDSEESGNEESVLDNNNESINENSEDENSEEENKVLDEGESNSDVDDVEVESESIQESETSDGELSCDIKETKTASLTISELKSSINESKSSKRKLVDVEGPCSKRPKVESDKKEIDCFRTLLQMGLKKEGMSAMVCVLDSNEWDMDSIVKKLTTAAIFQDALKGNGDFCYSSELLNFLKNVLERSTEDSDHWLSVKNEVHGICKDQILDMSTDVRESNVLNISILFHALRLVKDVLLSNIKILPNCLDLFNPLRILINKLPITLYPKWLSEEINSVLKEMNVIDGLPVVVMRMKKKFKIVELLEPELEDKFDPKKNVTKVLKKKIKNEKKALRKDIKLTSQARIHNEIAVARKSAAIRDKKTLAIINNIHQT